MNDSDLLKPYLGAPVRRGRPLNGMDNAPVQRRKIILALIESMAEHGYHGSTVTEIINRAKVSRRTFYEQFDNRESAFLVAYQAADGLVRNAVLVNVACADAWPGRLIGGIETYVAVMLENRSAALVFLRESWKAGDPAWMLRRRLLQQWAALLQSEVERARHDDPYLRAVSTRLSNHLALAVVQGLEGLLLEAIESGTAAANLHTPCVGLLSGAVNLDAQSLATLLIRAKVLTDRVPS